MRFACVKISARLISLGQTRSHSPHSMQACSPRLAAADHPWLWVSLNNWSGGKSRGHMSMHRAQLMQPRLEIASCAGWGGVAAGILIRLMQSTGQAGMQSSQPVQSWGITVCIKPLAPTIASTGQGGKHSAQPMHLVSSITAIAASGFVLVVCSRGASEPIRSRSCVTSSRPPGGQRSIAAPVATASA